MPSTPTSDALFLSDLVENRVETLEVEYKAWMPLTGNAEKAKIARHICALANSGGGYLVFGFNDDGSPDPDDPPRMETYGHDAINGIAERYLLPAPHCETHYVTSSAGATHPVIRVPSHGERPICAKRDGPTENGKPAGIVSGVHYVRVAGPKSIRVDAPELWAPIIRRCVFAERSTLLASIGQLFDGASQPVPQVDASADLIGELLSEWDKLTNDVWPVELAENRAVFGFRLLTEQGRTPEALPVGRLLEAIRSASFGSADDVRDGTASFESGWQPDRKPKVALMGDVEGYELCVLPTPQDRYAQPVFWRIGATDVGADVVGLPEDNDWIRGAVEERSSRRWPAAQRLSPTFQVRHVAQRVAFAGRLAEAFPDAVSCELTVDYRGLGGRAIAEPHPGAYFSLDRKSAVDARRVRTTAGVAALRSDIANTTAALVGPIIRLFDGWEVDASAVSSILASST